MGSRIPFIDDSLDALTSFHPHWDRYPESNWDTFERTVITIPPTYDLLKKFVGSTDADSDGRIPDDKIAPGVRKHIVGDTAEGKFMRAMQGLRIGGILIAGLKLADITATRPYYRLYANTEREEVFERRLQHNAELFDRVEEAFRLDAKHIEKAEIDFIFLHPILGIVIVEVKNSQFSNIFNVNDDGQAQPFVHQGKLAIEQLQRDATCLSKLLVAVGVAEDDAMQFFGGCIGYAPNEAKESTSNAVASPTQPWIISDHTVEDRVRLNEFFRSKIAACSVVQSSETNHFANDNFRHLVAILIGCRPDIFISPIQCILHWNHLIRTHQVMPPGQEITYKKRINENNTIMTSRDNDALSANDLLKLIPGLTTYDVVLDEGRVIYFTQAQQDAVSNPATSLVITGPPGSGKSLVQMVRLFIAMQLRNRQAIPLLVISSPQHHREYSQFLRRQTWNVRRSYQTAPDNNYIGNLQTCSKPTDFIIDEVRPWQVSDYLAKQREPVDSHFSLVLSSVYDGEHSAQQFVDQGFKVVRLDSYFRGTKTIYEKWKPFYANVGSFPIPVGHDYDGIPVEHNKYTSLSECAQGLAGRIRNLLTVEKCSTKDFAILFASVAEEQYLYSECFISDCYEFYLANDDEPPPTEALFKEIFLARSIWYRAFQYYFQNGVNESGRIAVASEYVFVSSTIVMLTARNWKAFPKLNPSVDRVLTAMRWLIIADGCQNGTTIGSRCYETLWDLNAIEALLTGSNTEQFLSAHTRKIMRSGWPAWHYDAIEFLRSLEAPIMAENFESHLRLIDNWPRSYTLRDLSSLQFPIAIVFTTSTKNDRIYNNTDDMCYADFLSLAFSRAQSHLIIYEWNPGLMISDEDRQIAANVLESRAIPVPGGDEYLNRNLHRDLHAIERVVEKNYKDFLNAIGST